MTNSTTVKAYSMLTSPTPGNTGTGLDQLVDIINTDTGLAGANTGGDIAGGAAAANRMNQIIAEAITQTGAGSDGVFTAEEVVAINTYIRANHLAAWIEAHGDDENGSETGFHLVQNDGATGNFRGNNAIDTVADGLYHLGFEISNGRFLNEDGDANASLAQVAEWLTAIYTDRSTTGTGLDRITDFILADGGLSATIPDDQIEQGADAANDLNALIMEGLGATGGFADGEVSAEDVVAINAWIRSDPDRLAQFIELHGDDENGEETGFHLVQNDGANTKAFGQNLINNIADSIYHIGFEINDGRFYNEDGDANATVEDVASWLNYFLSDQSNTGTGLDRLTDTIMRDRGLGQSASAADIVAGAKAANGLNQMLVDAIEATDAQEDGWITMEDLVAMNAYVRADAARLAKFIELHGDDENGSETGYHLVQNDGASTQYFGANLINTIADGLYHFGFEIANGRFYNEDGDANASLDDVSAWLNYFYGNRAVVYGTRANETLTGTNAQEHLLGGEGNDVINAGGGGDLIYGGFGNDTINGGAGNDIIYGQGGHDTIDGGEGSDTIRVSGVYTDGYYGFGDWDTYRDTGTSGVDTIEAVGTGNVDIATKYFSTDSGIEVIDGRKAGGIVRLLGNWEDNILDFRTTTFVGGNFVIDGWTGNDFIYGSAGDDTIIGGRGNDYVDGSDGSDTFVVSGNEASGYENFHDFDTYQDTGTTGVDTIKAVGPGNVDIGLYRNFGPSSGIEVVDASGAAGRVRLLGDKYASTLDFRGMTFVGNVVIDGYFGDDVIYGNSQDNTIIGGAGYDTLNGGEGSDTYEVTGNVAGGRFSFQDYDKYHDTGTTGTDTIKAIGANVDVGMSKFDATSGIEVIDGTSATGTVRLLGTSAANTLDFRGVTFTGNNIVIDADAGNDTVYGNDQANVINGGLGMDTLTGGAGADIFVFKTALSTNNVDRITDFNVADDTIHIDDAIFRNAGALGELSANAFVTGTRALDADDRFVYNAANGYLYYDADGSGSGGAVLFAKLGAGLALTHADFLVV
jgi:RTX calcium-binding nonapeptide repeat (4 copies)